MPKKIVIVGAVAGGMSAATRARRLDESSLITAFDKGGYTSFANCGLPYALGNVIKEDTSLILNSPKDFKDRFNIDVHLNTEVISIDRKSHHVSVRIAGSEDVRQVTYDKLILSVGAEPFRPPVEGNALDHVFTLQTIPDLQAIKACLVSRDVKRVCIIGAGFIGLEAAENLSALGLEISIIERLPHVMPPIDVDIAEILHTELRHKGINLFLNATATKIDKSRVLLTDGRDVPAELVILAAGMKAKTTLAGQSGLEIGKSGVKVNSHMQTSDPDIYAIGDMVETEHRIAGQPMLVALAGPANRQGRLAADHIFDRLARYRGNVGTAICRVFDLSVGSVGLSVGALRRMGRNPLWITVHPPDHAKYYPGAHAITLKVAFESDTGRLLGAQAVGLAGVDKRIDVLAMAMQADMNMFDLEHLELAYAPPYGSAKDPVNMAGFVGSNILRGDCQLVHGEDLTVGELAKLQVVDVRSPEEFSRGHIVHAINLPINSLREHLSMLDRSRPVVVYCQVGYRGYLAYRILRQTGFHNVSNLDGGYKSICEGGFKGFTTIET